MKEKELGSMFKTTIYKSLSEIKHLFKMGREKPQYQLRKLTFLHWLQDEKYIPPSGGGGQTVLQVSGKYCPVPQLGRSKTVIILTVLWQCQKSLQYK